MSSWCNYYPNMPTLTCNVTKYQLNFLERGWDILPHLSWGVIIHQSPLYKKILDMRKISFTLEEKQVIKDV